MIWSAALGSYLRCTTHSPTPNSQFLRKAADVCRITGRHHERVVPKTVEVSSECRPAVGHGSSSCPRSRSGCRRCAAHGCDRSPRRESRGTRGIEGSLFRCRGRLGGQGQQRGDEQHAQGYVRVPNEMLGCHLFSSFFFRLPKSWGDCGSLWSGQNRTPAHSGAARGRALSATDPPRSDETHDLAPGNQNPQRYVYDRALRPGVCPILL